MSNQYTIGSSQNQGIRPESPNPLAIPPNLVHKQYNSPLDLYSMDNIRETLEAHSEVLAPGVKGINFLKPDTPVNTESEVYKLVMQEDEQAKSRKPPQRISPISGEPSSLATTLQQQHQQQQQLHQQQHLHQQQSKSSLNNQRVTNISINVCHDNANRGSSPARTTPIRHVEAPVNDLSHVSTIGNQQQSARPICFDCDQAIVGPFVRLQNNKCLHADCFKCTTCGTNLKNVGHFTINDKLYCDIHVKQVQSLLQQQQHNKYLVMHQQQQEEQRLRNSTSPKPQFSNAVNQSCAPPPVAPKPFTGPPVTISNKTLIESQTNSRNCPGGPYSQTQSQSTLTKQQQISSMQHLEISSSQNNNNVYMSSLPKPYKSPISSVAPRQYELTQSQDSNIAGNKTHEHDTASSNYRTISSSTSLATSSGTCQPRSSATRGRGLLQDLPMAGGRIPLCSHCRVQIYGPYVLAGQSTWCKQCSQSHFNCCSCQRSLLNIGFVENSNDNRYYCEQCFDSYHAPICSRCNIRIKGDCLNALTKQWHPSCFVCGHCKRPFGNSSFYLEDGVPYCERDWNQLFTTKCISCGYPIEAGDRWIEALNQSYHSQCFKCANCQVNLEGSGFFCKNGKPYCRLHAR